KVVIEKNSSGLLALQGSIEIINDKGSLVYNGENASSAVQYHLLSTAKGEQSGVTLADGTVVYLDAATQIRYPVSFKGNERVVEILEGQAYFEVAHDGRPFYVKKGRQVVQVLGTVFNVMAYQFEQNMLVTLVSGKVNVNNGKRKVQIMPGSQAILSNSEESVVVNPRADVEQAVAWRHGQFAFHAVTLDVLLRQIERWYDVQVEVNGELPKGTFFYDGRRNGNLSELLRAFELNQIRYQLDAGKKKLIVNP
ncbi:MAG TPA: FecR domain-containing protein, partial [Flavisolibacter sp.]|nr:FecR domain-containing protein [Flavisolibacter sp.]